MQSCHTERDDLDDGTVITMVESSEDTGARFVIAVEDINGAWSSVQNVRESR